MAVPNKSLALSAPSMLDDNRFVKLPGLDLQPSRNADAADDQVLHPQAASGKLESVEPSQKHSTRMGYI
jgi:hypothetical protein